MKKNHEVGDSSLAETEIMPALSPPALRDSPAVLVPATVAFHVLPTEDLSGQQAHHAGLGTLTGPRADPGVVALK